VAPSGAAADHPSVATRRSTATGTAAAAVAAVGVAAVLGGCGGSAVPAAPAPVALHGTSAQVLAAAAAAMRTTKSVEMRSAWRDPNKDRASIDVKIEVPDRVDMTIRDGATEAEIRIVGNAAYMQANAVFWLEQPNSSPAAVGLGGRWLKLPATTPGLAALRVFARPHVIGRCSLGSGASVKGADAFKVAPGITKVGGVPAIKLTDLADGRRGRASLIYISAFKPYLPLRMVGYGTDRSRTSTSSICGVKIPAAERATTSVPLVMKNPVFTFSHYDVPLHIGAPHGAITIPLPHGTVVAAVSRSEQAPRVRGHRTTFA
jgi:hypothetical protein